MAAQPKRNRERIRRRQLVVDTTTALDLTNVKPHLPLKARGKALWAHYAAETPHWWISADIPTFARLCALADDIDAARKEGSFTGIAALSKEERQYINDLGLSTTSRTRLRMTDSQASIAAKKVEQLEEKANRKRSGAIDVDELVDG